jgi:hypothetical protein
MILKHIRRTIISEVAGKSGVPLVLFFISRVKTPAIANYRDGGMISGVTRIRLGLSVSATSTHLDGIHAYLGAAQPNTFHIEYAKFLPEEKLKKRVAPRVTGTSPAAEEFPKGLELFKRSDCTDGARRLTGASVHPSSL